MPLARTHVLSSWPAYPSTYWHLRHFSSFSQSTNSRLKSEAPTHLTFSSYILSWFNHTAPVPLLNFISSHLNCRFSYTACPPASSLRVILHATVTMNLLKSKYDFILFLTYNPSKASWWLLLHPMSLKTWILPTSHVSSQAYLIPAMPRCLKPHDLSWVTFPTCYSTCPRCPFLITLTELTPTHLPKLRAGVSHHCLKT